MIALEARDLAKHLGGRKVLDGVDLQLDGTELVALVGANGAGKSTLLRVLAGILEPDRGEARICGHSLRRARAAALRGVGYAPESADFPPHLGVGELVDLVAALRGRSPLDAAARSRLGVEPLLRQRLGALSLGQRRRALLAAALTGSPALLLLDEPTNGLDEEGLDALVDALGAHARSGRAALIASHDDAFLARVATTQVTLRDGRVTSA